MADCDFNLVAFHDFSNIHQSKHTFAIATGPVTVQYIIFKSIFNIFIKLFSGEGYFDEII